MIEFVTLLIIALVAIAIVVFVCSTNRVYLNGRYTESYGGNLKAPKLVVDQVKAVYTTDSKPDLFRKVAEYTCSVYYLVGKNKVKSKEIVFYDEIGKWKVGDELQIMYL